jgi:transcriptional regulator with XRE-family HTH domain
MTTWNLRLADLCGSKNIGPTELSRLCKVSAPTASGWLTGKIKTLEAPSLLKICDVFGVDPWWLVLGIDKGKAPITEDKSPLSSEAQKLILWVARVDGLGDPARKLFAHIHAALQVAGALTQVQNKPVDEAEALAGAKEALTSHIENSEGKQRATPKHKP